MKMMTRLVTINILAVGAFMITLMATNNKSSAAGDTMTSMTRGELSKAKIISMSEQEQANQVPGQSNPGAGESVYDEEGKQIPNMGLSALQAGWAVYANTTYRFSIGHPNGFVVRPLNDAEFAEFSPTPLATIFFMNPTMAAGALAGIEPPDLAVQVYQAETVDSLRSWLVSMDFASPNSGTVIKVFQNDNFSGLEVCQAMMISPGCTVYVLRSSLVYRLTPTSLEGEMMIGTFSFLP